MMKLGPLIALAIILSTAGCTKKTEIGVYAGFSDPGNGQATPLTGNSIFDYTGVRVGSTTFGAIKNGEFSGYMVGGDGLSDVFASSVTEFTNGVLARTYSKMTNFCCGAGEDHVFIVEEQKQVVDLNVLTLGSNRFRISPTLHVDTDFGF